MFKLTKISLLTVGLLIIAFGFFSAVFAQDIEEEVIPDETIIAQEIEEDIALDEMITAQDLEITEPKVLPDSPFYFLKRWQRGIKTFFTFNSVKKAELNLRYASEKLLEMRKLVQKTDKTEIIEKAAVNYQKAIEKIKLRVDKIKEKASENKTVENFLDKFTKHQIFHDRVLEKVENQVPSQAAERIREVREKQFEKFGEVINKLMNKEEIRERLEKTFREIKGSGFKDFKNLEILRKLEEKVPQDIKEKITEVRENTLNRLKEQLKEMSVQGQEKFRIYTEKIQGKAKEKIETLKDIQSKLIEWPEIKQRIKNAQEKILERVKEKAGIKK